MSLKSLLFLTFHFHVEGFIWTWRATFLAQNRRTLGKLQCKGRNAGGGRTEPPWAFRGDPSRVPAGPWWYHIVFQHQNGSCMCSKNLFIKWWVTTEGCLCTLGSTPQENEKLGRDKQRSWGVAWAPGVWKPMGNTEQKGVDPGTPHLCFLTEPVAGIESLLSQRPVL